MNSIITFFNTTGKTFIDFSAPMLIQSSVLIIVLLVADMLLRKKVRAVFRYCVWILVLVKLVLPVTLSAPTGLGHWFGDEIDLSKAEITKPLEQVAPGPKKIMYEIPAQTDLSNKPAPAGNSITKAQPPREFVETQITPILENNSTPAPIVSLSFQGFAFLGWLVAVALALFVATGFVTLMFPIEYWFAIFWVFLAVACAITAIKSFAMVQR